MSRFFSTVSCALLVTVAGFAQSNSTAPAFEMADVRASAPGTQEGGNGFLPNGRFEVRAITMLSLIEIAYGIDDDEKVIGGPSWLDSTKFDILAKAPQGTTSESALQMLQTLLADRFKLAIHKDEKSLPVFTLSVGKRGPQFKQSTASGSGGCKSSRVDGLIVMECQNVTLEALTQRLRGAAGAYFDHPLIDVTGLKGNYDVTLKWTPRAQLVVGAGRGGDTETPASISVYDAVDKVGLKLEAVKRSTPVIVVDSVNEKPTDNAPGVKVTLPAEPTEFDVAEVRASKVDPTAPGRGGNFRVTRNQLEIMGMTLRDLMALTFDTENNMVVGGPKWMETDRFDVIAKAPSAVGFETMQKMLRPVLKDHFKMTFHEEEQPMPAFALVQGRRLKLKDADPSNRSTCKPGSADGMRNLTCQNTTMAQLAEQLRNAAPGYIKHPVVDLTTIKGAYDFVLSWTPSGRIAGAGGARGGGDASAPPAASTVASVPTAEYTVFESLDKQLGLKLEERKTPQKVLVIDHVEKPAADN